ncbi:MAG: hypothetical protein R3F43_24325 [bacterium]
MSVALASGRRTRYQLEHALLAGAEGRDLPRRDAAGHGPAAGLDGLQLSRHRVGDHHLAGDSVRCWSP